ncbi:Competence-damaged family protein [Granulibacter bethesdensis]|uniref:Competence-damaged family protein n=1 Tax=Granulibacter bethesdensis TaxID=364410 RepID=A0AAC9P8S2_9PROT|nr:nicotinamide-nucleotide amidohydrolase family protein [Granulibacter bethesdensis]APH54485.1 Competence-damaged family protein [Granulibacter bethesdensis]APH62071.1 Competence-damaged family protein [Granulibacter bethesdensis]
MIEDSIIREAIALVEDFARRGKVVATAESCTGGLIAATLTAISGASAMFDRGFVTYSNASKSEMLGVPLSLIEEVGAVSEEVALAMAQGALNASHAEFALSVTGIAGPTGESEGKPVGLVWFGLSRRLHGSITESRIFPGNRTEVRAATVAHALHMLREAARD